MNDPQFEVRFGGATHQGMVRGLNEDSYLTMPPLFLVADGMGGHARGEVASRAVVDAFLELGTRHWLESAALADAVRRAWADVSALSGEGRAPGSTLTGVGLSRQGGLPCWLVFNIGDSRTYLMRSGQLQQVSQDHAATEPRTRADATPRHVITRAVGAGMALVVADQWLIPAQEGDRILICSDGLSNEVTPELMNATLLAQTDPQSVAQELVQAALNAGGHDNVTVVVVDCVGLTGVAAGALSDTTESDTVLDEEGRP